MFTNAQSRLANRQGGSQIATSYLGTATIPALAFNKYEAGTGFTTTGIGKFGLTVSGSVKYDYGISFSGQHNFTGTVVSSVDVALSFNGGRYFLRGGNTALFSPATAVLQLGIADAASPVAQTLQVQSVAAGNANTAGATFTINGSKSNGSGGGDIVLQTTLANAGSGTQNTLATALTLKGGTQAVVTAAAVGDTGYQYATPTTGQTVTITASQYHCIIDPAGTLATLTVALPAGFDGQYVDVKFSQAITSLTVSSSGNTVKGAPTSAALGASFTAIYRAANTTWYI